MRALPALSVLFLLAGPATAGSTPADPATAAQPTPVADAIGPVELITAEEAAAEPASPTRGAFRELTDGPVIRVDSPETGKEVPSPFPITIRFEPGATGHAADPQSLQVHYVKLFAIDITGRVRPFVAQDGIRLPEAKVPPGNHTLRLSIADTAGNLSAREFTVAVAQ